MKLKADRAAVPYSYLIDNVKVLLIFLVVFNHIIAFNLVKVDIVVRYIWYAITIFHMPAFIFISGYLSKKPQNVMKNVKNLLIPYILGYSLTWYSQIWLGRSVDYEILRPTGTVMWYVLALFVYRLTVEGFGQIRFIVPLSIIFALWAGTRPEFSTFLSASSTTFKINCSLHALAAHSISRWMGLPSNTPARARGLSIKAALWL